MTTNNKYYSRYFTYIQPALRSPIVKTYGSTVFTLIALSIFIFFAIKPTVETIVVLQKKLTDSQEVLRQITQKNENLTQARKNYQNLDPNLKSKISSTVPTDSQLRSTLQSLEAAAISSQASISAIQVQPLTIDNKQRDIKNLSLSEIQFTFNVESNYENLLAILTRLKTSNRLIAIDNITFNKVETGKTIIMSVTGRALYLK